VVTLQGFMLWAVNSQNTPMKTKAGCGCSQPAFFYRTKPSFNILKG